MLFLTSPDASLNTTNLTQGVTPGVLKASADAASGGDFASLLNGAKAPRTLSSDTEEAVALTPETLNAALGKAGVEADGEGQTLPLQRQAMVGVLPALELEVSGDGSELSLDTDNLPSTSWLARLFGLGPTEEEATEALDSLDSSLNQVTATIAQLLGVKPLSEAVDYDPEQDGDFNVEAALSELGIELPAETVEQWVSADTQVVDPQAVEQLTDFLHQELGLNLVETETVIQALTNWVQNPPHINLTAEQLAAADSSQWQQVEQLTQLLDELEGQFSSWLDHLDTTDGDSNDAIAEMPTLSKGLRMLADALSGKDALASDGKVPSPAVMISRMLQSVQNSATQGSLPITLDQSRPEQALLLVPSSQPSSDVVFSTALMKMASETLGGKSETDTRLAAMSGATVTDAEATTHLSTVALSQSDSPEQTALLDLKRADRPMISADVSQRLSERIQMMAQGDIKYATIRLDPPELGTLEIKVTVQNDQTQVQIVSPHPQVREALEAQSARLREILEQQGLNLSNLDVRDQSADSNAGSGDGQGSGERTGGDTETDAEAPVAASGARPLGLVDQFV